MCLFLSIVTVSGMILDDDFVLKNVNLDVSTDDFIEKCDSIRSKSHIKLNKKGIREIGDAILCRNAKVFFLQDNKISNISNFKQFSRITHLYLQNNKIHYMEGFQNLVGLVKLYLGSNSISVVENLENCGELEELYVGTQRLSVGEKMIFDPRSIEALSESLLILHCPGNSINEIGELEPLTSLEELDVSCSKIENIDKFASSLEKMISLTHLDCDSNPFCSKRNYKGKIVVAMKSIQVLNKTEITRGMYAFYKTLTKPGKRRKSEKKNYVSMDDINEIIRELPSGIKGALDNPDDYAEHISIINKHELGQMPF